MEVCLRYLVRQIQRGADAQVQVDFHCFISSEVLYVVYITWFLMLKFQSNFMQ